MKKSFKFLGGGNLAWLVALFVLSSVFSNQFVWAQQQYPTHSGGQDGYLITGKTEVTASPDTYVYDQQVPDADQNVYWVVTGAKLIEGKPADSWPEGSLRVADHPKLIVEWQDSIPTGQVALRSIDKATQSSQQRFFLSVISIITIGLYDTTLCNPSVQWSQNFADGNYSSFPFHDFSSSDPTYAGGTFCPGNIHSFRFNNGWGINCSGGARPYRWRFLYITEHGHGYVEEWSSIDPTVPSTFYTQVPVYPFNGVTSLGDLHPEAFISLASNPTSLNLLGLGTPFTTYNVGGLSANPYANEKIVAMQIQVRATDCGFLGTCGSLTAFTSTIQLTLDSPIVIAQERFSNGQLGGVIQPGQSICLGRQYALYATLANPGSNGGGSLYPFYWTTDVGTITSSGSPVILDLTQLTSSTAPFRVNVTATTHSGSPACVADSPPTTASFLFGQTDAPQNLRMDNGSAPICGFPTTRTIRVNPSSNSSTLYNWTITNGPGTFGNNMHTGVSSSIDLTFNGPGLVTVEVTAYDDCSRESNAASNSFRADPNAVPQGLSANLLNGYFSEVWKLNQLAIISVATPQSGVTYAFSLSSVEIFNAPNGPYYPGMAVSSISGNVSPYAQLSTGQNSFSTYITVQNERVASVTLAVTASNSCGFNTNTASNSYYLLRPFHGSYNHRPAAGASTDPQPQPQLYPNPTQDLLHIAAPTPTTHYEYVVVLNDQGTVVQEVRSPEGVQELNLQALPTGIYAVRLFDGERFVTLRVAKE